MGLRAINNPNSSFEDPYVGTGILKPPIPKIGTITATWTDNSSDGYSGVQITNGAGSECHSESSLNARPPTNAQATTAVGTWTTCKKYQTETTVVTDTELYNGSAMGYFFMRQNNILVLTYSGWTGGMEMSDAVYTINSRRWTIVGGAGSSRNETTGADDAAYTYVNWTMPSSGSCTMTWTTTSSGDPPYLYWSGSKAYAV